MFQRILLSLFAIFLLPNFINSATIQDIYFDSESTSSQSDGSKAYPFKDLLPLLDILKSITSPTEVAAYLEPRSKPYSMMETTALMTINNPLITSFTLTSRSSQEVYQESDCDILPTISGTGLGLILNSIPFVNFIGVRFIQMTGTVQINSAQGVVMADLCLENDASMMFEIKETEGFMMKRVILNIEEDQGIIDYSNSGSGSVNVQDITINFLGSAETQYPVHETAYLRFNSKSDESTGLLIHKINLKNAPQTLTQRRVFEISGFNAVEVKELNLSDQEMQISSIEGVFDFKDIKTLTLEDISILKNKVYVEDEVRLFSLKDVEALSLIDINISGNFIMRNPLTFRRDGSLRFFQVDGGVSVLVDNLCVIDNEGSILTNMIQIDSSSSATSLNLKNMIIDSNRALNTSFNVMKFSDGRIEAFEAHNISITSNSFSSRIFDIYTVGDELTREIFELTDISVKDNKNLANFGLLILFVRSPSSLPPDYVPDIEYYSVKMKNLIIENNKFFKAQRRGGNSITTDKLSVIQIAGAQLYIEDSKLLNNDFTSYSFVSLYRELSSIFFVNSTVNNTNFTEAHFMITRYEALVVTEGPFFNIPDSNRRVQAIYRYAFVLDSNFTNIQIQGGSLFTFHNAFLLMENNNFDLIDFVRGVLLNAGKFRPPGSDLIDVKFMRNPDTERDSLERLNPQILTGYHRVRKSLQDLYDDTVYFYVLTANNMTNLKIYSQTFIDLEDYQSQQSFICVMMNVFSGFDVPDVNTDLIKLSGALTAFNFFHNTMSDLNGDGSILHLSELEENRFFEFNNNTIQGNKGPSILTASGTEISNIIVSFNKIEDNTFSSSLFIIDMILHNGNILFIENVFKNNVLNVGDKDLNTINSFIEVSSEASNATALFVFERCEFIRNTYNNFRVFNQYSQLNAMINLLLANSSLIIKDTIFKETKMINPGNDLFYIAAENVMVFNCTFDGTEIKDGQSIFNLLSWSIIFHGNKFFDTKILLGKGLVYISPYPFLKETVDLQITSNYFNNVMVRENAANLLFVENANLLLTAWNNSLIDTFSLSPVFYFSNTNFIDSLISNFILEITKEGSAENFMYWTFNSSGVLNVTDQLIKYYKQDDSPDTLFTSQRSPDLNVTISNLTWAEGSFKNAVRLANVDSGNILIADTVVEDFVYPLTSFTQGLLINVGSATSNKALNLRLTLRNVRFKNLTFNVPTRLQQNTFGLIGFLGSENTLDSIRPWILRVKNCSFISIKNVVAIYINQPLRFDVIIDDSVFDSLYSRFGPAFDFYAKTNNESKIIIANSTFSNNRALKAGGAIYMTNSSRYTIRNNQFINNSAGDLGGSMILQDRQRTDLILQQNKFINNSATVGDNIASLPTKSFTRFIFPDGTSLSANDLSQKDVSIRNVSKVALNISLVDNDGQISLDTSNTGKRMAIITFADQPSITTFNCTKWGCYINSLNTTLAGDSGSLKLIDIQYSSEVSKFNFQKKFNARISPCIKGEHFNPNTKTCDFCGSGTYSLTADDSCRKCPENAYCPGGSVLMPNPGYWRSLASDTTSPDILECRKDGISRCNASLVNNGGFTQCSPGYEGVKCEACVISKGYVETGLLQCKKCSNPFLSFLATILSVIVFSLVKLYCIRRLYGANESLCSMTASRVEKQVNLESTYYVRLLMIYTQILSMIYLFHMEIRELVGSYTQLGNPTEFTLYKLECSMQYLGIASENYIFGSVIYLFLSPFIQLLSVLVISRIFIKRLFQPSTKYFLRLCSIYIVLSEQPGIVGFMTGFLSCSQDDIDSPPYVGLHPSTKCNTAQYFIIRYFIVIPCLIIWGILIPIYAFSSVYMKRGKLNSLSVRLPWGSLYNLYRPQYCWWGSVTMVLGILLGFTTYYFQGELKTCLALAFILLWIYQIAVRHAKPYKYDSWNKIEATTMGLLVLNLMLGYFTINTTVIQLKMAAYLTLAVINGAMLAHIVYKIVSKKVATYVDLILERLTSNKKSKKKAGLLQGLLENDVHSRSESVDTLGRTDSYLNDDLGLDRDQRKSSSFFKENWNENYRNRNQNRQYKNNENLIL